MNGANFQKLNWQGKRAGRPNVAVARLYAYHIAQYDGAVSRDEVAAKMAAHGLPCPPAREIFTLNFFQPVEQARGVTLWALIDY